MHEKSYGEIDNMIDELFVDFKQTYPSFQAYSAKKSTVVQMESVNLQGQAMTLTNYEVTQEEIIIDSGSKTTPKKFTAVQVP